LKRGEKVDLRRKSKEELLRLLREDKRMGEKEKKDVVPLLERIFLMEDLKTKKPIPIIFKSDVIECLKGLEKRKIMVKGSNYAVLWKDIKNIFGEVE